jgi:hypothetical protein
MESWKMFSRDGKERPILDDGGPSPGLFGSERDEAGITGA